MRRCSEHREAAPRRRGQEEWDLEGFPEEETGTVSSESEGHAVGQAKQENGVLQREETSSSQRWVGVQVGREKRRRVRNKVLADGTSRSRSRREAWGARLELEGINLLCHSF